jgi:7-cyano-7-deazaguanine synthase in queuosine biosynthesis
MKTLVICSGGLDSVSLAHKVAAERDLAGLVLPRPAPRDWVSRIT